MSKYTNIFVVTALLLISGLLFTCVQTAGAEVSIGGEVKSSLLTGIYDGKATWNFQEQLELKLLLPRMGKTDAAVEMVVSNTPLTSMGGGTSFSFKKLYLRHRFEDFNLTVGRQPVSWSFGSLLNPVDYTLGAVAMDQETGGKYQDAVEVYLPVNWNTGLALVASQAKNNEEMKWGIRGRTELQGYDLTASFIREPGYTFNDPISGLPLEIPVLQRAGVTAKGDLGPFGIYGALGYYLKEGSSEGEYSYLVGGDYNYTFGYDRQLIFQLEYLNLNKGVLEDIMSSMAGVQLLEGNSFSLLAGNVSYPIDDFSSLGLMVLASIDDGSQLIVPTYQNQLGSNLNLTLRGMAFNGDKEKLFGIKELPSLETMKGSLEISLGYSF